MSTHRPALEDARNMYGAKVDAERTHADDCHHWHNDCAYLLGRRAERRHVAELARAWAAALPEDSGGRIASTVLTDFAAALEPS